MRMLLSFGVRRHMVHAAPEPSYEAMLALDENNPRRGVKKHILEQLPHVRALFSFPMPGCQGICLILQARTKLPTLGVPEHPPCDRIS